MATLTLEPAGGGSVDLLNSSSFRLQRETSVESMLPLPTWDEVYIDTPDTEGGARLRSRPQNPVGAGRLVISGTSVANFRSNIVTWQRYVEAVRQNGGTLTYTPTSGSAVIYDLLSMHTTSMPQDLALASGLAQWVDFDFTCAPFGRLAAGTVNSGTFSGPIDTVTIADPGGSAPALAQLVLTDTASQDRGDVQFGIDDHWDANLNYPAAIAGTVNMVTTGFDGTYTTRTGAWTTTDVVRGTLLSNSKTLCQVSSNHLGSHRVKGRFYGSGTGPIYTQFKWRIGEAAFTTNGWKELPVLNDFCEVDLGLLRVPKAIQGTQGWEGWIDAYTAGTITDSLDVAALQFLPADRYGRASSQPIEPTTTTIANVTQAHDEFDQTSGTVTGKTLPQGGTWTLGGTVTAVDFSVDTSGHTLQRTQTSDTNPRIVYASTNTPADTVLRGDLRFSAKPTAAVRYGWLVRWADNANYAIVWQDPSQQTSEGEITSPASLNIGKVIAGSLTTLRTQTGTQFATISTWYSFEVSIDKAGNYSVKWGIRGSSPSVVLQGQDDVFKTSGTLDDGKAGIYDYSPASTAVTRSYDNFVQQSSSVSVTTATARVAMNSGKQLIIDHEGTHKEPATGAVWTKAPKFDGSYLKVLPNQTSRLVIKARRNNIEIGSDSGLTDAMTYALVITPRVTLLG